MSYLESKTKEIVFLHNHDHPVDLITELMEKGGYSMGEIASKIGVTTSVISRIMKDRNRDMMLSNYDRLVHFYQRAKHYGFL